MTQYFFGPYTLRRFTEFLGKTLPSALLLLPFTLVSCSSSIKSEANLKENQTYAATPKEMHLYRQISIGYVCYASKFEVDFPKAIGIATTNFSQLINSRHGGMIEEAGKEMLSSEVIFWNFHLQLVDGAIKYCPDDVPIEEKEKFNKVVENINKQKENKD